LTPFCKKKAARGATNHKLAGSGQQKEGVWTRISDGLY
jgi:hypothetical protein